ncbi:metallophosphoesterase family protein [Botrimarina mediterranea]|uniref:Serine/threonine-protein phosphatase 1 n=1 Tax=Botrimarina mediterranea TaxID=2528022 RepID=A0A518KC13_9BACT|nr:metallophosphoesterase family protein [Botrimarina mediterranea]QDV75315.1 Serine/threonine-protein phosphatase 1 [Botrimarina mediterranea]QDV79984.1 Serine/threonine-protein phosphatase 1 [Planctomycetes bacterium K2D]
MPRLIAIGDIHGCSAALRAILEAIELGDDDHVVTLGDYVDRGPDSRGVIDQLLELDASGRLTSLLGNHEEMMLGALRGSYPRTWWFQHGGVATLDSYGFVGDLSVIPQQHLDFIDRCLPYYETDDFIFTHANYVADEPMDRQPAEALRWQSLQEHTPKEHFSGKRVIVGHTAQKRGEVQDLGYLVCLDTYCHGGGWLTARDVETGQTWQVSADGALRV